MAAVHARNPNQVVVWRRNLDQGGVEALGSGKQERSNMNPERQRPAPPSVASTDSAQALREENERPRAEVAYQRPSVPTGGAPWKRGSAPSTTSTRAATATDGSRRRCPVRWSAGKPQVRAAPDAKDGATCVAPGEEAFPACPWRERRARAKRFAARLQRDRAQPEVGRPTSPSSM